MAPESIRVALLVTDMLERLSIAYAVEGSLSKSDYGVARSALKAHIIADIRQEHVEPFVSSLSQDFYVDHHRIDDAIANQGTFALVHYATKLNVDVNIPKQRPFDQMQMRRRRASIISSDPPRQVSVTSPEDSILSKLERVRARQPGRPVPLPQDGEAGDEVQRLPAAPRALSEVIGILKSNRGDLDLDYLGHWANELDVGDLLEQALSA
jgi:hypothetical protein